MELLELEKLVNSEYFWIGDAEIVGSTLIIKDIRDGYTFELTIQEEDERIRRRNHNVFLL